MLTDSRGAGDAAISRLAAAWSWGASLTTSPTSFSCLKTPVFADEAAGACYSHTGGSANPLAAPRSVSDGGPARAGLSEQHIDMKQTPGERTGATTIRKMSATPLLWSLRRVSDIHLSEDWACRRGEEGVWLPTPSGFALGTGSEVMTRQTEINALHTHLTWSEVPHRACTCRAQSTSQGGSTPSD